MRRRQRQPLTFAIANRPTWATFDGWTGRFGNAGCGQHPRDNNIVISVSDGPASAPLPAFSIAVAAPNIPPTMRARHHDRNRGTQYSFTPSANDVTATRDVHHRQPAKLGNLQRVDGTTTGNACCGRRRYGEGIMISVSDGQASAQLPAVLDCSQRPAE